MKDIFSLGGIGSIASIVALCFFVYYQFIVVDSVTLEIKTINEEELTKIPEVKNLKSFFTYKDSAVNNLWKIRLSIKNIGGKTLVGEGQNKDIIGDCLELNISNNFKIFNIEQRQSNFPLEISRTNRSAYQLKFKQWRQNEFVELIAFVENDNRDSLSKFTIDDRTIIDGTIRESNYRVEELAEKKKLIDHLPHSLQVSLRSAFLGFYIVTLITLLYTFYQLIKSRKKTKLDIFIYFLTMIIFSSCILWLF